MKLRCVSFVFVAAVFGLATMASADIVETLSLQYTTSYNSNYDMVTIPFAMETPPDGSTKFVAEWNPSYAGLTSEFDIMINVAGLSADQDLMAIQVGKSLSGTMACNDFGLMGATEGYVANNPTYDPPLMGSPTKSNAPSSSAFSNALASEAAIAAFMTRGTEPPAVTNGNGTYGDMGATVQFGETGLTKLGTLYLAATGEGTFSFQFDANPGYLEIISGNLLGMGVDATTSFPTYTGIGDSVAFVTVPEPSSIVLLGCGLFGLLAYAWRKRK